MCSTRYYVNLIDDSSHDLIDDSSYAAEKARLQARMAYWTKESAHVKDQNALTADKRSNPYLNEQKAWLPWCPDSGCTPLDE